MLCRLPVTAVRRSMMPCKGASTRNLLKCVNAAEPESSGKSGHQMGHLRGWLWLSDRGLNGILRQIKVAQRGGATQNAMAWIESDRAMGCRGVVRLECTWTSGATAPDLATRIKTQAAPCVAAILPIQTLIASVNAIGKQSPLHQQKSRCRERPDVA